ncbi:hypothetical protein LHYA1_G004263 [Lachnellula hyalina]|uniref:Uncharacterized protein n=1 Tax=Lachnellula hyalina TaxID=1316788 RepID=A0A8H8R3Y4_9HELO|nr:uncharacterized protein LHYA1_G004263 [Lachnellula hyalina]TVY27260.1 hypothetical protein LHYA1_G004263 [Lachnellula hyalina]
MSDYPTRPQTPQAMLHRLPDKPDPSSEVNTKPSKYIILIIASTAVAGKVQIAKSVASALSCPLFQGDSLHETSAKAASVGASRRTAGADAAEETATSGANEARYQRMWLSKMTRTGLLFPDESRSATSGFTGFGGASSSTSTSRRGSSSSIASELSDTAVSTSSIASSIMSAAPPTTKYINKPSVFALPEDEKLRKANPALMVVTHPELEQWHKDSIRKAVGEYSIGVIYVPLHEDGDEELPVLKPLDPRTMTSFAALGSFGAPRTAVGASLDEEIVLRVNVEGNVEEIIEDIVEGVREIMSV